MDDSQIYEDDPATTLTPTHGWRYSNRRGDFLPVRSGWLREQPVFHVGEDRARRLPQVAVGFDKEEFIMTQQSNLQRFTVIVMMLAMIAMLPLAQATAEETQHEGTFLNVGVGRILILSADQQTTLAFPLAGLIKVTKNGYDAGIQDLRRGDMVQLTTEVRLGTEFVTAISAVSRR
jgi:hypothetical protein